MKRAQKRAAKVIQGLDEMLYTERLKALKLFRLSKRSLRLITTYCFRKKIMGTKGLFNLVGKGRTKTSDWKLGPGKFQLEIRPRFIPVRMVLEQTPKSSDGFSIF